MIKCPACEEENEDGVVYCDQCGADLSTIETPEPDVPPTNVPEQPVPPTNIPEQPVPATNVADTPPPPISPPSNVVQPPPPNQATGGIPQTPTPSVVPHLTPLSQQAALSVVRGDKPGEAFQIWDGLNIIGRADPQGKPIDIDLEGQETSKQAPSVSRQHAAVKLENGVCTLEDLGSSNGTFVNRGERLQPGQPLQLNDGDEIIVGLVYLKFSLS